MASYKGKLDNSSIHRWIHFGVHSKDEAREPVLLTVDKASQYRVVTKNNPVTLMNNVMLHPFRSRTHYLILSLGLLRDGLGHVTEPGINLVTYVWFAAMQREQLLQQIAWEAVLAEPMSGVTNNH